MLVVLDICDPLSFVAHSQKAVASARAMALKLKDVISRQQFDINLQARIHGKVCLYCVLSFCVVTALAFYTS